MSFVSNLLGANNGYNSVSGAGGDSAAQQKTDQTNFTNVQGNQSDLAKQLLAQSQGAGPNIANLQLQQATNQNNQQGAGMIASQRGMNPALAARIIANQTAMNNQNAAGQSGVLRAQQQLAAQSGLANVYGQQAGESEANLNRLTQAQTAATSENANAAQSNANQNGKIGGGILGGAASFLGLAEGGQVGDPRKHLERLLISIGSKVHPMHFDNGGDVDPSHQDLSAADAIAGAQSAPALFQTPPGADPLEGTVGNANLDQAQNATAPNKPSHGSFAAGFNQAMGNTPTRPVPPPSPLFGNVSTAIPHLSFAGGGMVDAMISPGERVIPPHLVEAVRKGKKKASDVAPKVPGKAKVKGDSEANDIVPAKLAEGSVVVKRTKAGNDSDAREFLLALKKEKDAKEGPSGYAKILAAKRKKNA